MSAKKTVEGYPIFHMQDERGLIEGCYDGKTLMVWVIMSDQKGFMSECLNKLTKQYGTNKVEFTQVIGAKLFEKLHGFKPIMRYNPQLKEKQLDLVGTWRSQEVEGIKNDV